MAHATNLAKGRPVSVQTDRSRCRFYGTSETQQHINAACIQPPLVEMRRHQQKRIDEFFQYYRHQHLPASDWWVIPLIDYMEEHIWTDSKAGGEVRNSRWTPTLLSTFAWRCRASFDWTVKLLKGASVAEKVDRPAQRALLGTRSSWPWKPKLVERWLSPCDGSASWSLPKPSLRRERFRTFHSPPHGKKRLPPHTLPRWRA